jgi:hypothetical protein
MPNIPPVEADRHTAIGTTRLLAAGTYLDDDYREQVLDSTVRDPTRFVCPAFGVDIAAVVRHALVAHRRAVIRDSVLLVDAVALLVIIAHGLSSASSPVDSSGGLLGTQPVPDSSGSTHSVLAVLLLAIVAVVIVFVDSLIRQETLFKYLIRGRDPRNGPALDSRSAEQLAPLRDLTEGNLVVFSSRRPFVGSGVRLDSKTVALPLQGVLEDPEGAKTGLDRERRRGTPQPFTERDLIDRLAFALKTLDLPGSRVQERIYVNGVDARLVFAGRLMQGGIRPAAYAGPAELEAAIADPLGAARHYLCVETTSWYGHLVSTSFIRIVRLPEMLYVDSTSYALPPLQERFFHVDTLDVLDSGDRTMRAMGDAFRRTVPLLIRSAPAVLRAISAAGRPRRALAKHDRALRDHLLVDQGAYTSVRQAAAASAPSGLYFLDRDMIMHMEAVAARIAEELPEFLAERGYDIGELDFRQFFIDNRQGVIGAVGTGAHGTATKTGGDGASAPSGT